MKLFCILKLFPLIYKFISSGNFSSTHEILSGFLKYDVCLKDVFYERKNSDCMKSFPELLETFLDVQETLPEEIKVFHTILSINVCLTAVYHEGINSYCLSKFPDFLEIFQTIYSFIRFGKILVCL